ncbi:Coiled-coil-helix-coiled-coil-helix domain-containing protein 2 [Sciurus carolinensis]|uniref:Coiled-coil-helix-coiled-coil-helix domain-containing protein 2 n=1 Tax=Sciurus carolinensis TaxID=30640 RepID=A0AA41T3J3_SCICA|nr:Coiled-coil-helix-coiled-coil-helix domain-containing protein 2 [Sciurus carolinensis]
MLSGSQSSISHVASQPGPSDENCTRPAPAAQLPAEAPPSAVSSPTMAHQQLGLKAQMMNPVAGVPMGSAVGTLPGHAITEGFSRGSIAKPSKPSITCQEPRVSQPAQQQ